MVVFDYIKFNRRESLDILMISAVLSIMFTLTFFRIEKSSEPFLYMFFIFFFFIVLLLLLRMLVMKFLSYFQGFKIFLRQTDFDQYWFRSYDRVSNIKKTGASVPHDFSSDVLSAHYPDIFPNKDSLLSDNFRGIPSSIVSLVVYILLIGYFIFPALWRYSFEKIPHKFFGKVSVHETEMPSLLVHGVTGYRFSKVMIGGFTFYILFALILKLIFIDTNSTLFLWFYGIIFYIAIFGLMPIPGTEGFDMWHCSRLAWFFSITITILGLLSVVVFTSLLYMLLVLGLSVFMVMIVYLWKTLM